MKALRVVALAYLALLALATLLAMNLVRPKEEG